MATTTATPLDTKAEAKAAKKKEPKPSLQRTLAGQEGLGSAVSRCCRLWSSSSS